MNKNKINALLLMSCLAWLSVGGTAEAMDQDVRVSSYCTKHFSRLEREYGIPKHMMMAVASTESGRWNGELNMALPWPWTVNAEGKGYYFNTKHEAVAAVQRMKERGVKSMDVGCMQINLYHHPDAFASIGQAFDPKYNTAYAAKFLKQNYDETRSWRKAVSAYHSKTASRGRDYFAKVRKNWKRTIAAVSDAGLNVAKGGQESELAALMSDDDNAMRRVELPKQGKQARAAKQEKYRSPSMKIIKVSQSKSESRAKDDDVLVIRPEKTANAKDNGPVVVASNAPSTNYDRDFVIERGVKVTGSADSDSRISTRKKGPNFIFY